MKNLTDQLIFALSSNKESIQNQIANHILHMPYQLAVANTFEEKITNTIILAAQTIEGNNSPSLNEIFAEQIMKSSSQTLAFFESLSDEIPISVLINLLKQIKLIYLNLPDYQLFTDTEKFRLYNFISSYFDQLDLVCVQLWSKISVNSIDPSLHRSITGEAENNKYQLVYDRIYLPIFLLDDNQQIVDCNSTASTYFPNLSLGNISESIQKLQFAIAQQFNEYHKWEISPCVFEIILETFKGESHFKVTLQKENIPNNHPSTIVVLENITHYHEVESHLKEARLKAEESDSLKTAFLANMSHEIRTPMNAILGFTELLLHSNHAKNEREEFLLLIRKSSNDLLTLIEDIIDIAKMEANQLKIKYKICHVYEIFTDLEILFNETLRRYGIKDDVVLNLVVDEKDKSQIIYCDTERLKQIMTNLLNNAAKFTSVGKIDFGYKSVENKALMFFVRDTGEGIPETMKSKVFDRFVQAERALSNHRGAGLGLAICKNIVSLMGGQIWVESEVGKGSDFYFVLPNHEIPENFINDPTAKISIDKKTIDLTNKTILVAEDDEINFLYIHEILRKTNARIIRAVNGLEAINITESEENISLILMDIKMPLVDGLEASKYISGIRPNLPIIAQTAFAMNGDNVKCFEAGCCDYLSKPVDQQKLLETIEKYLNKFIATPTLHEVIK